MKSEEPSAEVGGQQFPEDPGTRTGAGFLAGLVFGACLGAGLALLFAPDRGAKTRSRLRRRMRAFREDALGNMDQVGTRTREELRGRKRQLRAELERIRARAKERAREARKALD
jgi:gas vesicle protein